MTEIQRWAPFDPMALMGRHPNGAFVTYADHVADVAAAREDERKQPAWAIDYARTAVLWLGYDDAGQVAIREVVGAA